VTVTHSSAPDLAIAIQNYGQIAILINTHESQTNTATVP
jgi:hypothetical protein